MDGMLVLLKKLLQDEIDNRVQYNAYGNAADFAAYKENAGFIRGLETAVTHINDLAKRMEQDDDE